MIVKCVLRDELGLDDQALLVVWQRAGLEGDDVLALHRLLDRGVVGTDDPLVEDPVDVSPALGVLQHHLVPSPQLVQVPEDEEALRPGVAETVAGDVDVRLRLPREVRVPQVERASGEFALVGGGAIIDGDVPHPLHLGDRELEPLALRGRSLGLPHAPDVGEHEPGREQDQSYPHQRQRPAAPPPPRPRLVRACFLFVLFGAGPGPEKLLAHDRYMIPSMYNKTTYDVNNYSRAAICWCGHVRLGYPPTWQNADVGEGPGRPLGGHDHGRETRFWMMSPGSGSLRREICARPATLLYARRKRWRIPQMSDFFLAQMSWSAGRRGTGAIWRTSGLPRTIAALLRPAARVQGVAEAVSDEVDGEDAQGDGYAGEDDGVLTGDEDAEAAAKGVGEHRAPLGRRSAGAEAQEGEGGHVQDGRGQGEGGLHDQGRQTVREHAGEDDLGVARPQSALGLDVVSFPHRDDRRAHDPRHLRHEHDPDGEHRVRQARAEDRDDDDGEQDAREGQDDVHDSHQHRVQPAAEVPGRYPDYGPDGRRYRDCGEASGQRDPGAVDHEGEDVPAPLVLAH